jgi:uncharacterized OsmC-like protein
MAKSPTVGKPVPVHVVEPEPDAWITKSKAGPGGIRTLRCRTVAMGRFQQLNYIRDLPPGPITDAEPEDLLGESVAPSPSEALLAAVGSCLAVGIHANALVRRIPIRRLELRLEADINTTAAWGSSDIDPKPIGFEAVRVSVEMDSDASHEALDALVKHATLWSPVANTLYNPVHLDVTLARAMNESDRIDSSGERAE